MSPPAPAECHNTVYMIVYATGSKILRRIVIADQDWHYGIIHKPGPGESCILAPAGFNDELPDWENHVHTATGVVPPDPRCAVIVNGVVVEFCNADPEIDESPKEGGRLILLKGKQYCIGDRFDYRVLR